MAPIKRSRVKEAFMWRARLALLVLVLVGAGAGLALAAHPGRAPHPASRAAAREPIPHVAGSTECRPTPRHPDPVVLVPGTFGATSWDVLGPALAGQGYCVFVLAYGDAGTIDVARSAAELGQAVDRILAVTGAHKVAIVGHSEGGMMPRYYIKRLGGAAKVSDLVALAPSNHGTMDVLALLGAQQGCTACGQQFAWGSTFLQHLNAGDETPPAVAYTVIETALDAVVTPYTSAFLSGPSARVTNVTLQNRCPADLVDHLGVPTDPVAVQWVENALAVPGPADPAFRPRC
jgi:triacylglycerol lipase